MSSTKDSPTNNSQPITVRTSTTILSLQSALLGPSQLDQVEKRDTTKDVGLVTNVIFIDDLYY